MRPFEWLLSLLTLAASLAQAQTTHASDTDPILHDLCSKQVVLLGEPPTHSFGNTLAFKVQLVRRLVDECHFNALFLESGVYDYLHIQRTLAAGRPATDAMISAAIGGLWANQEVQSLVPFLTEKVNARTLTLGGLDDQLGAGTYASREMAPDLVQPLPPKERSRCQAVLQRHLLWQYTDDAPYGPADKQKMLACLSSIQTQLQSSRPRTESTAQTGIIVENLQRTLARNFTEDDFTHKDQALQWFNDRDRSMDLNFNWLRAQLPPNSRIIVWAATVHTAKDLTGVPGFEGRVPLGSYIHRALEGDAYSLAFSALSGEYAFTHQPIRKLSDAPPQSLEAQSLEAQFFAHSGSNTVYLPLSQLQRYGSIPARPLDLNFNTARWDQVVDGMVIFRQERAPAWIKRP